MEKIPVLAISGFFGKWARQQSPPPIYSSTMTSVATPTMV